MTSLLPTTSHDVSENMPDIGIVFFKTKFSSENDSGDLHIQIGNKGALGYRSKGGNNSLFGGTNTPEIKTLMWVKNEDFGIGKISTLNSLGYCIGNKGVAWADLHTGEVHMKVLFEELNMGRIEKIDTIQNIGYGAGGIFKFTKNRKLTRSVMGDAIADMLHSDVESKDIEWKHSAQNLGIGNIKQVLLNYEGDIVIGTTGFCIIDSKGNTVLTNTYKELGFTEIIQVYKNGWIVGTDSVLQIDFQTGRHIVPVQPMNIKEFIDFSQKNKHFLMEEPRWDNVIQEKSPIDTVESGVSAGVRKITQ